MIYWLDLFGIAVFASSGALAAGQRRMDLFGVIVLAFGIGVVVHGEDHPRSDYLAGAAAITGIALIVLA